MLDKNSPCSCCKSVCVSVLSSSMNKPTLTFPVTPPTVSVCTKELHSPAEESDFNSSGSSEEREKHSEPVQDCLRCDQVRVLTETLSKTRKKWEKHWLQICESSSSVMFWLLKSTWPFLKGLNNSEQAAQEIKREFYPNLCKQFL